MKENTLMLDRIAKKNYGAFLALSEEWFASHQSTLLRILNTPVVGSLFRRILCIDGDRSAVGGEKITKILPHALFWSKDGEQYAEFRTHQKFSKRLYYAFKPVWWAMHAWDWMFADRFAPDLSFGFLTLTAYPDPDPETTTVDGTVQNVGDSLSWANIIAAAGTGFATTSADSLIIRIRSASASDQWIQLWRGIYLFNTSSLTASAVISAAVFSIRGTGKVDESSSTPDIDVYTSAPASNTDLEAGDFDSLGSTSQTGTPITYAGWATDAYNDFTFDATGRGNISKTGISKFGVRNANHDVAASAPSWASLQDAYLKGYFAEQTGTANDPKLVVTYTIPSAVKTAVGLAIASVKTKNGLATASIKTWNGLV